MTEINAHTPGTTFPQNAKKNNTRGKRLGIRPVPGQRFLFIKTMAPCGGNVTCCLRHGLRAVIDPGLCRTCWYKVVGFFFSYKKHHNWKKRGVFEIKHWRHLTRDASELGDEYKDEYKENERIYWSLCLLL